MTMTTQTAAALLRALPHTDVTTFDDGSRMIQREGYPEAEPRTPLAQHSVLLQRMVRRRDEMLELRGEGDATGERLIEILTELEATYLTNAEGAYEAGADWLREVGEPAMDEWATYDDDLNDDIKRWRL